MHHTVSHHLQCFWASPFHLPLHVHKVNVVPVAQHLLRIFLCGDRAWHSMSSRLPTKEDALKKNILKSDSAYDISVPHNKIVGSDQQAYMYTLRCVKKRN
jgi:hypothetical protein